MAKLGGIITIIFMVFDVILYLIYGRKMNEVIIKSIFQVNNSDLDEDEDEDPNKINKKSAKLEIEKSKINSSKFTIVKSADPTVSGIQNNDLSKSVDLDHGLNQNQNDPNLKKIEEELEDGDSENSGKRDPQLELQKTIKNIEQPRKERKKDLDEKFEFTLYEHFCSTIFPCCSNTILKKKLNIYESLLDFVLEYTDIVSFSKTKSEVEKLKYVLFTTKQLALFNMINPPENPLKPNLKKRVSMLYKYSLDQKAQIKQAKKYLAKLRENPPSGLDKKLLDLFA
jgi:hypothetical protein